MKQTTTLLLSLLLFVFSVVFVHAAEPEEGWLDISLIQPRPYRNWALLVINQGYDASKQKRVELPFDFAKPHAEADLLHHEHKEYKLGGQLSHSLDIFTIELLDIESLELLASHFKNLPKDYSFKEPLIAHKRQAR